MLQPKRAKYRRTMRGIIKGKAQRGAGLLSGHFGLKALQACWLTARQIEAARKAISHFTKKGGRLWIRIFPDKPLTKKPPEVRMGGGKAPVSEYAAVVHPGKMLFELSGVSREVAKTALGRAAEKLPIGTRFVTDAYD